MIGGNILELVLQEGVAKALQDLAGERRRGFNPFLERRHDLLKEQAV